MSEPSWMPIQILTPIHATTHFHNKSREKGALESPHHNKWNFHCGPTILNASIPLRATNPSVNCTKERIPDLTSASRPYLPTIHYSARSGVASDYYWRHPKTYIRCQSHVILSLDGASSPELRPSRLTPKSEI